MAKMGRRRFLSGVSLGAACSALSAARARGAESAGSLGTPSTEPLPPATGEWRGFERHDFEVGGAGAIVVSPAKALSGRPWVWRGEFFDAFADADEALVRAGWHLAYLRVPNLFGAPSAMEKWEALHERLVGRHGLDPRPGLIGLSRGGLYCLAWAARHPSRTLALYLDNAVCDFRSWPGGRLKAFGAGKGSARDWPLLLNAFGFRDDAEAACSKLNPIRNFASIAAARIPLLLVYGDSDTVVPAPENSEKLFEGYRALGGPAERILKPGCDHHPHGLTNQAPIVEFFMKAWARR